MKLMMDSSDFIQFYETLEEEISFLKYPYFQLRGKPITEEQAFEIIRRTDNIFYNYIFFNNIFDSGKYKDILSDYIYIEYKGCFSNDWFISKHGWAHPDGTIGTNAYTGIDFPIISDFISDWDNFLEHFPFLDLVVIFERFSDGGFWVHDNTFQLLQPKEAIEIYEEYNEKYGVKNPEIYDYDYSEKFRTNIVDINYLKRCLSAYGIEDTDKFIYENFKDLYSRL